MTGVRSDSSDCPHLTGVPSVTAELAAEPTDPARHARLAERLVISTGPAEALRYVRRVEERRPFPRSAVWYRAVADICQVREPGHKLTG